MASARKIFFQIFFFGGVGGKCPRFLCLLHFSLYFTDVVADPYADVVNCTFPYTYNGGLYYQCIENMTEIQPCGCLSADATPAVCQACPQGMTAGYFIKPNTHRLRPRNETVCWSVGWLVRSFVNILPTAAMSGWGAFSSCIYLLYKPSYSQFSVQITATGWQQGSVWGKFEL